jgi:hypothetical protein
MVFKTDRKRSSKDEEFSKGMLCMYVCNCQAELCDYALLPKTQNLSKEEPVRQNLGKDFLNIFWGTFNFYNSHSKISKSPQSAPKCLLF